jgi:two-component system chemotaxis response regulator CheB
MDDPPVRMLRPSVDVLFESAAVAFGRHLLSVVLTGTGSDGAAGTRAVHARGGVALVQSPDSAEFAGMPEAAIATGAADRVVSLARIGRALGVAAREGRTRLLS